MEEVKIIPGQVAHLVHFQLPHCIMAGDLWWYHSLLDVKCLELQIFRITKSFLRRQIVEISWENLVFWTSITFYCTCNIYGIHQWRLLSRCSNNPWALNHCILFRHSNPITYWSIRPWIRLALRANFVQLLQSNPLISFQIFLCQSHASNTIEISHR